MRPKTMPGAEMSMMRRRPTMSMYLRATRVKTKFVPETMRPTAVGWSKPIWAKSVAEKYLEGVRGWHENR